MADRKQNTEELKKGLMPGGSKGKELSLVQTPHSVNETPVDLLDPELSRWIKVIKASRASLTYERYE